MLVRWFEDGFYVCRKTARIRSGNKVKHHQKTEQKCYRNWFFVKYFSPSTASSSGMIYLNEIRFPKEFIGKRIRLKVEVLK